MLGRGVCVFECQRLEMRGGLRIDWHDAKYNIDTSVTKLR